MLLRTNPAFNYFVMGPRGFGPFAFPVSEDSTAEREFKAWMDGKESGQMPFGARPGGQYYLWRQPITSDLTTADLGRHADMIHEFEEDELVAAELLPLAYNMRPMVPYDEFRFLGQVSNWHASEGTPGALGVEDIFLVHAARADRVLLFGVYAEASEQNPRPFWTSWLNTTVPAYAPRGTSLLRELSNLVNFEAKSYGDVIH